MKKILGIILVGGLIAGCGKENTYSNDFGSVLVVNATTSTPPAGLTVFVDTIAQTATGLAYRTSSGYLSVRPGSRKVELRSTNNFVTTTYYNENINFPTNQASTIFIYDTLATGSTAIKTLRLIDTLTLPAQNFLKVRFVPLAPKAGPVDVTFTRTSVTPNDSVTISNFPYVGTAPSAATLSALSAFRTIPAGAYTIRLKAAGTGNVLASSSYTLAQLAGTGNQLGILTFYSAGSVQNQALTLNAIRHYP